MKTANWSWTCTACGTTYPPKGYVAVKTDAEEQWRRHRANCTGERSNA